MLQERRIPRAMSFRNRTPVHKKAYGPPAAPQVSGVRRKNFHWDPRLWSAPQGVRVAMHPGTPENLRKFGKKFRKKIAKIALIEPNSQKKLKTELNFGVWRINISGCGNTRKFLMKIQQKNWISIYFRENLLLKKEPSEIHHISITIFTVRGV